MQSTTQNDARPRERGRARRRSDGIGRAALRRGRETVFRTGCPAHAACRALRPADFGMRAACTVRRRCGRRYNAPL
jgi:hypothetical protein